MVKLSLLLICYVVVSYLGYKPSHFVFLHFCCANWCGFSICSFDLGLLFYKGVVCLLGFYFWVVFDFALLSLEVLVLVAIGDFGV